MELCRKLATGKKTPDNLARQHLESVREAAHLPLLSSSFDDESDISSYNRQILRYGNYQLDNSVNFQNMLTAMTQVIIAIRNGTAVEVPDYYSAPDIICDSCADNTCEIKHPEINDFIF